MPGTRAELEKKNNEANFKLKQMMENQQEAEKKRKEEEDTTTLVVFVGHMCCELERILDAAIFIIQINE